MSDCLTREESDVFNLAAQGLTSREIAMLLLSAESVKVHLTHVSSSWKYEVELTQQSTCMPPH